MPQGVIMNVTGPSFIALQVRDLARAAEFYETRLGLTRATAAPPHAVVFATEPAFAVREPLPGVDLDAIRPAPGAGMVLWLRADDPQALHDSLVAGGVEITAPPFDGPFGRTFGFRDLDGYVVTVHG
jgi:predicted enzyme related to lactoylglutathione lyase